MKVLITIPENIHEYGREVSKEVFGQENFSGLVSYLLINHKKNNQKNGKPSN